MQSILTSGAIVLAAPAISAALPTPDPGVEAKRDTEPVILTGLDFDTWSVPASASVKLPLTDLMESGNCALDESTCDAHNEYVEPEIVGDTGQEGTPVDRLLGYRWNSKAGRFDQIPFQVDEVFTRYLDNSASGFAFYSGQEQHTTYAYDREGFRYWESDPNNPCLARPAGGRETTPDPVKGLDSNDELAFMADDAGPAAPKTAPLPEGIEEARRVRLVDTSSLDTEKYVYVMKAAEDGPRAAFDAQNGHVSYERDPISDIFEKSESSYENYGNARRGVVCDAQGNIVAQDERRRPRDYATITTDRYKFRYDGRWLMTDLRISADRGASYGPDLVDRWKARAFQQDPSSETPCCGYEEEDTNWGGSSTLLGERSGPVRAIRETWGSDSGTNVIRRETFYRREMRQKTWLRVHVIPPLDGIYAQWDFNAGVVDKFYSSANPKRPHAIDGQNDEVYGNFDDPCNGLYDNNGTSDIDQAFRETYRTLPALCDPKQFEYHQSIDLPDFTKSEFNAAYQWNLVTGPNGSVVDRIQVDKLTDLSPGGAVQSLAAVPYYRDDSCFDDGTGSNPGPRVKLRSSDEPRTRADGTPRKCWAPEDGAPDGSDRFYQGSIATHGLHILAIADSDNARQTFPLTEIVAEQRMVMLPGLRNGTAGEQYGRGFEKRLVPVINTPANPVNQKPTASIAAPVGLNDTQVAMLKSTSTDPDGRLVAYDWDLDSDGEFDDAQGATVERTFPAGTHTIALRVTDESGGSDIATAPLAIASSGTGATGQEPASTPPATQAPGVTPPPTGAPPTQRPAGEPAPLVAVASVPAQTAKVTRAGRTAVRIRCAGQGRCRGLLVLKVRRGLTTFVVGKKRFSRKAGSTAPVMVKLNALGRKLLKDGRKLRVRADTGSRGRKVTLRLVR